ncbi:DUF7522 family protein [Haladaptatus sp. NG-WS-4]
MSETGISDQFADEIATTCRTGIGDTLRSVIYFTPDEFDLLYLRSDLYGGDEERARKLKAVFVENERLGFDTSETYRRLADRDAEPAIGDYELTLRAFSDGFVSRVIVDGHGVLLTSDSYSIADFEEVAVSVRKMLENHDPAG